MVQTKPHVPEAIFLRSTFINPPTQHLSEPCLYSHLHALPIPVFWYFMVYSDRIWFLCTRVQLRLLFNFTNTFACVKKVEPVPCCCRVWNYTQLGDCDPWPQYVRNTTSSWRLSFTQLETFTHQRYHCNLVCEHTFASSSRTQTVTCKRQESRFSRIPTRLSIDSIPSQAHPRNTTCTMLGISAGWQAILLVFGGLLGVSTLIRGGKLTETFQFRTAWIHATRPVERKKCWIMQGLDGNVWNWPL